MLIHPWDAAQNDTEWQSWLAGHDFGQLAVSGPPGQPPFVQPLHFAYEPGRGEKGTVVAHLARPNPIWAAVEANPLVTLSVVDDWAYIPVPWHAPEGTPPEHGTPTSFYAAVQLTGVLRVVDDAQEKADLLHRQLARFQPAGDHAEVAPDAPPYGRMLPGIRGIVLEVAEVRAKFKYGGNKPRETQERVSERLALRGGPGDAAARAHQLRRLAGGSAEPPHPGAGGTTLTP